MTKAFLQNHQFALPSHEDFFASLHHVIQALEQEDFSYRPAGKENLPGGFVDLASHRPCVPTMLVPDLHGRGDFFQKILVFRPNLWEYFPNQENLPHNPMVLDLLEEGAMNLVCVGDGLHSELHRERWLAAFEEYEQGKVCSDAMKEEMAAGLGLMTLVMKCKAAFPRRFHFLKGNHENILNRWERGDRPFKKFAKEGEMGRSFVQEFYGEDILYLYSRFESSLPLLVKAPRCLVSHSEPARHFSRQEVVESLADKTGEVVFGLTWTRNDESQEGAVKGMLQEFFPELFGGAGVAIGENLGGGALYFGGHRTIPESYRLRQGGRFVQFHNPRRHQVAFVPAHRPFDFDKDLIQL